MISVTTPFLPNEPIQAEEDSVCQKDPTQETTLLKASSGDEQPIIAYSHADADNALITLITDGAKVYGRNPEPRVVARVEYEQAVSKVGAPRANHVISLPLLEAS